jgi:hypothetical protein
MGCTLTRFHSACNVKSNFRRSDFKGLESDFYVKLIFFVDPILRM